MHRVAGVVTVYSKIPKLWVPTVQVWMKQNNKAKNTYMFTIVTMIDIKVLWGVGRVIVRWVCHTAEEAKHTHYEPQYGPQQKHSQTVTHAIPSCVRGKGLIWGLISDCCRLCLLLLSPPHCSRPALYTGRHATVMSFRILLPFWNSPYGTCSRQPNYTELIHSIRGQLPLLSDWWWRLPSQRTYFFLCNKMSRAWKETLHSYLYLYLVQKPKHSLPSFPIPCTTIQKSRKRTFCFATQIDRAALISLVITRLPVCPFLMFSFR